MQCAGASSEIGFGELPVHEVAEERLDELLAQVAIVNVVGMLPHVDRQQRLVGRGQRRAGGTGVDDVDRAIGLLDQPGPARTEVADRTLHEGFLERGVAAPLGLDRVRQGAAGLTAALGLHAVPEEGVVPDLRGVVVDAAGALLDDLFKRQAFELGAFLQVVEVDHIGVVMLAMVELQRFLAVVRGQGVDGIGQRGQRVFHGESSDVGGWETRRIVGRRNHPADGGRTRSWALPSASTARTSRPGVKACAELIAPPWPSSSQA
mmetsp:Transcript_39190/g.92109  ORF Transcript_39190/g.92109 Transcript_39190/m.92109 type:complete len:263 (+) Transcript_39190:421-1209(+)